MPPLPTHPPTPHAAGASCHSSCQNGAGCLGPSDQTLCGTCLQSIDTCSIGPAPTLPSCDPTPIPWWPPTQLPYSAIFGVFFTFIAIIVLVVLGVLVFLGIKLYMRLKESQKGSFDINVCVQSGAHGGLLVQYKAHYAL